MSDRPQVVTLNGGEEGVKATREAFTALAERGVLPESVQRRLLVNLRDSDEPKFTLTASHEDCQLILSLLSWAVDPRYQRSPA